MRNNWLGQLGVFGSIVGLGICGKFALAAAPAGETREVHIVTSDRNSLFYGAGTSFSRAIAGSVKFSFKVDPLKGTLPGLLAVSSGKADLTPVSSLEAALAYQGPDKLKVGGKNTYQRAPRLRLFMRAFSMESGMLVRKDSKIHSVTDLRGHRVAGEYPEHQSIWYNVFGILAGAGMDWRDIKVVPVNTATDGINSLIKGESEAAIFAVNGPKVKEADHAVGVRYIPNDCTPEGTQRMQKAVPVYYSREIKKGAAPGIAEDTCVLAYDAYLLTREDESDEVVTALLSATWEHLDAIQTTNPTMKTWTRERAVDPAVAVPYHPAAVKFFQAKGLWTDAVDKAQKRLLEH